MKLKKIASLALAGVMAVSMLAGCATNNNSNNNNGGTTQVTTTGVVATFQNALKSYNPDLKITVKENSALANAIKSSDSTKNLSYADLLTSVSAVETLTTKLYTSKSVTPEAVDSFDAMDSSKYADLIAKNSENSMLLTSTNHDDSVRIGVCFMTNTVANGSQMAVAANTFAQAVKTAGVKNTYEKLVSDTDYTAEYTLTLYSAQMSNINGESGTLLVMVIETNAEAVKD